MGYHYCAQCISNARRIARFDSCVKPYRTQENTNYRVYTHSLAQNTTVI